MKKIFLLLFICAIGANSTEVHAQKTRSVTKVVKSVAKKVVKTKPRSNRSIKKCSYCNGQGKITYWNPYYGCYQTSTCSRCNGYGYLYN